MEKVWYGYTFYVVCSIVGLFIGSSLVLLFPPDPKEETCILNSSGVGVNGMWPSAKLLGGSIVSEGNKIFGPSFEIYYAWYAGKREESGEACKVRIRVTQNRFEQIFYK